MNLGPETQIDLTGGIEPQIETHFPKGHHMVESLREIIEPLAKMDTHSKIEVINQLRTVIAEYSPFTAEPVDCVQWVKMEEIQANDYNPNAVAPPEMELLRLSIMSDGYTQPIVSWRGEGKIEVIDGFHRNRVCQECDDVRERVHGYLPIVTIKEGREGRNDRIASTIRHNRARGKHKVEAMSDIVIELKRRNWSPKKIGKQLGMDQDEVLRLVQITGLAEMFADQEFSEAWEAELLTDKDYEDKHENLD